MEYDLAYDKHAERLTKSLTGHRERMEAEDATIVGIDIAFLMQELVAVYALLDVMGISFPD